MSVRIQFEGGPLDGRVQKYALDDTQTEIRVPAARHSACGSELMGTARYALKKLAGGLGVFEYRGMVAQSQSIAASRR